MSSYCHGSIIDCPYARQRTGTTLLFLIGQLCTAAMNPRLPLAAAGPDREGIAGLHHLLKEPDGGAPFRAAAGKR